MGYAADILQLLRQEHEALTSFKAVIDSDHAYIHKGIAFTYSSNTGELAAAATYVVSITTPANKVIHLRPAMIHASANIMELRIARESTVTGGSAGTPVNRNQYTRQSSAVSIAYGVTLSAEGTVIDALYAGQQGAGSGRTGGAGTPSAEEIILDTETVYSFRFANIGATTASTCYFRLFWYEETKGADYM